MPPVIGHGPVAVVGEGAELPRPGILPGFHLLRLEPLEVLALPLEIAVSQRAGLPREAAFLLAHGVEAPRSGGPLPGKLLPRDLGDPRDHVVLGRRVRLDGRGEGSGRRRGGLGSPARRVSLLERLERLDPQGGGIGQVLEHLARHEGGVVPRGPRQLALS